MTFRFIHSSDLHLGKRFGQFEGDLPGRLREARHQAIGKLAAQARDNGADTILLAGDTFDTETPDPSVRRQALSEMRNHAPIRWVILPGNHDSLLAAQLWEIIKSEAPDNVILALEPNPIDLPGDVVVLPAPCSARRPGRDLTAWMDDASSPEGAIRLGLAHGAVQSFSEDDNGLDVIAPDRAHRARLSYMALGDWHGRIEINPRTYYSGTPEPDRFKHDRPGEALLVAIDSPLALPQVTPILTGMFEWISPSLYVLEGEDSSAGLADALPEERVRRHALVNLSISGRARLEARTEVEKTLEKLRPDFAYLRVNDTDLVTEVETGDLDAIDRAGALREAADLLLAESENPALAGTDRAIARDALARLYSYSQAVSA